MFSPKRVLVSEGSSLSSREAITALGMAGHVIDVCDPNPLCLGRFSRFTRRWHRCPVCAQDPWAYFDFILRLLRRNDYDVLFPAHDQAFLFSRRREQIPGHIGLAVADFHSFLQIQGRAAFVRTLSKLSIAQPGSRVVRTQEELEKQDRFPVYLKVDYGTASTGVWQIGSAAQLHAREAELTLEGRIRWPARVCASGSRPGRHRAGAGSFRLR